MKDRRKYPPSSGLLQSGLPKDVCRHCGKPRYRKAVCKDCYFGKMQEKNRQKRLNAPPRKCKVCGKEFQTTIAIQAYCSLVCRYKASTERQRITVRPPRLMNCRVCDKEFAPTPTYYNPKYCSSRCGNASKVVGLQYKLGLKQALNDSICERCQKPFTYKPRSGERSGRFCTIKCWYMHNAGMNSPLKREGVFHCLPARAWRELTAFIRERQNNTCEMCGIVVLHTGKRKLAVDHIVPRRLMHSWGIDPHQIFNLVGLCGSCHAKKTPKEMALMDGDVAGFVTGLMAINYPVERVREAFVQLGFSVQILDRYRSVA